MSVRGVERKEHNVIVPEIEKSVVITIMERFTRSVEDYGEYSSPYKKTEEKRDVEMEPQGKEDQEENDESERKRVEEQLLKLGEAMDERMKIGGIKLTPASTLKQLRNACKFLKVGRQEVKLRFGKG